MAKRLARLALADLQATGSIAVEPETLCTLETHLPTTRANDGRCGRDGAFYRYTRVHGLRRLALDSVAIANSICFSPDGRRMHYCDTLTRRSL